MPMLVSGHVVIFDISNPANPRPVGQSPVLPHRVYKVAVAGDCAYVTDEEDLYIINVRDPAQPVVVATAVTPGYARAVAVQGAYAYIGDGYDVRVFDVSDPANPVQVGMLAPSPADAAQAIVIVGEYAYAVGWVGGLHIIHIADPVNLVQVGNYDTPGFARDVAAAGNYVYIADDALLVVDVRDPAHPTSVGVLQNPTGAASDLAVVEGPGGARYIYLADGYPLNIINVTDSANPVLTLDIPGGYNGGYQGVAITGNHAYFAYGGRGMAVWDISDPASPTPLVEADTAVGGRDVAVRDDAVFIADWTGGLVAFAGAELRVAPAAVSWMVKVDGADPASRAVQLTSTGRPITWTATIGPTVSWLETTPLTGTTASAITVTAHITGLVIGRYTTTITFAGPHNAGAVPVTLIVAEDVYVVRLPLVMRH